MYNASHVKAFETTLAQGEVKLVLDSFEEAKRLRQRFYTTRRKIQRDAKIPLALIIDRVEMAIRGSKLYLRDKERADQKLITGALNGQGPQQNN